MNETELDSFAARFQSCSIPKSEWTHQAHLKIGMWHVRRFGKDDALDRLRTGIQRLNDSHGVPNSESRGYHETITRVYVTLLDAFLREVPEGRSVEDLLIRLLSSRLASKDFPFTFYSRDRLMSPAARKDWLEPDLGRIQFEPIRRSLSTSRSRIPWKNGNGWTEEIAVFPPGATMENFDWRVSIAGTDKSSAFSAFPGIDRSLALLQGSLSLAVGSSPIVELSPASRPVSFPGDEQTFATLYESPIVDLNVMTRRERFTHTIERRILSPQDALQLSSGITLAVWPATRNAILFEQPARQSSPPLDSGEAYIIRISRGCC